jgi:hypothetical protein
MGCWTHLIFESYCRYSWSKNKFMQYVSLDGERFPKKKNPVYNAKDKRPNWCKRKNKELLPQPDCYFTSCPFLIMDPVSKVDHKIMLNAWERKNKKG